MSDRVRLQLLMLLVSLVTTACAREPVGPELAPPEPPGYSLSVAPTSDATVRPGEQLFLDLLIQREAGFAGEISFSAQASEGIVVIVQPKVIIKRDDTDVVIVADQAAARRKHDVVFTGQSEGLMDRKVIVEVTVVD